MKILWTYLKPHRSLVAFALLLAAINQIFSLLDPLIFRHVIDNYASHPKDYTRAEFFRGVALLLGMAVGVAFVSRVAKNFQDYFVNVITQKVGAQIYSDGLQHSLELPYQVFEDQRSGQTLGTLQKVRSDVEKLIAAPDRKSLIVATRALDRVLLWHHLVVPHWYAPHERVAYWDMFAEPATLPSRSVGFPTVWWFDEAKAKALQARK